MIVSDCVPDGHIDLIRIIGGIANKYCSGIDHPCLTNDQTLADPDIIVVRKAARIRIGINNRHSRAHCGARRLDGDAFDAHVVLANDDGAVTGGNHPETVSPDPGVSLAAAHLKG